MKIAILETYYTGFLDAFYSRNPVLRHKRYDKQLNELLAKQFATADFYSKNLKKVGYDARDFIINNEVLQKAWASEHKVKYKRGHLQAIPKLGEYFKSDWFEKILQAQIKDFKPDITYVQNAVAIDQYLLEAIKQQTKRLLVAQISYPINDDVAIKQYDLLITPSIPFIEKFKKMGLLTEYLALGFERDILKRLKRTASPYEVVFIGGFSTHHRRGNRILEEVARLAPVDFWGYGTDNLDQNNPILDHYHGPAWGFDMFNILHNAKIAINRHVDVAEDYAGNMRLYEATGVGTMLITDHKVNLHELFNIGKEVETYKSAKELVEKIKFYLKNDRAREKIAKAGQARTLKDHSYQRRMKQLDAILKRYL